MNAPTASNVGQCGEDLPARPQRSWPWRDRRTRLEDLLDGRQLPRVAVVPVTDDAPTLYETWVGMGACALLSRFPDAWARSVCRGAVHLYEKSPC